MQQPSLPPVIGRWLRAPEGFVRGADIARAAVELRQGRRDLLCSAFAAALAGGGAAIAHAQGDPHILEVPTHGKGLGNPVATDGYGRPSQHERNVQRRQSPGLTQTRQASVSFAPLQSLFGIVTPTGLHFERHHQGWWDVDPTKHRLMLNGSDARLLKTPMVFTMDQLMRLPSVSRFHFIECGANTGMEWGNVAVPTPGAAVSCSPKAPMDRA